MAGMPWPEQVRCWWSGWSDLARRGEIAGYDPLGLPARLWLDACCVAAAPLSRGFWRAVLLCMAVGLAAQLVIWELDLRGWPRDALQCLAPLLAAPWVAAARRRYLLARVAAIRCGRRRAGML